MTKKKVTRKGKTASKQEAVQPQADAGQPRKEVMELPENNREPNPEERLVGAVPPMVQVDKDDMHKLYPDTIEKVIPYAKEKGKEAWVSDPALLKSVKGSKQTLGGTAFLGELLNP